MEYKVKTKRKTNDCMVTVRTNHECYCCGNTIKTGERARTINPQDYNRGRKWMCMSCINTLEEIDKLCFDRAALPFDDEGGNLALYDWAESHFSEFVENCRDSRLRNTLRARLGIH